MTAKNDVTGDRIVSKAATTAYRNNKFWEQVEHAKQQKLCEELRSGVQEAGSFEESKEAESKE